MVDVETGRKDPCSRIAYEDIRVMPRPGMVEEMMNKVTFLSGHSPEGEEDAPQDRYYITSISESDEEVERKRVMPTQQICTSPDKRITDALIGRPYAGMLKNGNNEVSPNRNYYNNTTEVLTTGSRNEKRVDEGLEKDVGKYRPSSNTIVGEEMSSQEAEIIHDIKSKIGTNQVTVREIAFARSWVIEKAMKSEQDQNWTDAYLEVAESDLPKLANIISSHVIFKVKKNDDGTLKRKDRIVVHGNKDAEKDMV